MAKNEGQTPDTGGVDVTSGPGVHVVGQTSEGQVQDVPTSEPRESASAPVESFKLTKLKEEDALPTGLVELEFVGEGAFMTETGDVLREGDRKVVSTVDAEVLLDAKANGKTAFKRV